MSKSKYVGVDGCKAGWFSVALDENGGYEFEVFKKFRKLVEHYNDAKLILVDIPIGLPGGPGGRECDALAWNMLGYPRNMSVFPTPTRKTVKQAAKEPDQKSHQAANDVERRYASRGISIQAFSIAPKINKVDKVMRNLDPDVRSKIREVHPELCFWALNGKKPMEYSKKKKPGDVKYFGINERLEVLDKLNVPACEIYKKALDCFQRKNVDRDDIVDALVAAVTAYRSKGKLKTVPANPQPDCERLPMEMVYWIPPKND